MKNKIEIQIRELNNKSRKGSYIYIKSNIGKPRYYKYNYQEGEIEAISEFYKEKYFKQHDVKLAKYKIAFKDNVTEAKKPKKKTTEYKQVEKYIKKIKKRGTLNSNIKKGITSTIIHNAENISNAKIKKAKTELVERLIYDKDILELIIRDENFNKLRNKFEYHIIVKDRNNKELLTCFKHNETLQKILEDIKKMKKNKDVRHNKTDSLKQFLKEKGYKNIKDTQDGKIHKIDLKIIFRKA